MEPWAVVPGLIGRPAHEADQAARDWELLVWIARFRFVTAELVARRLGVSWQRANARLRRLERERLIARAPVRMGLPLAVYVTGRGFELLDQRRRKAPRVDIQREHELAIVAMAIDLERHFTASRVLTERECRAADTPLDRFSTDVIGQNGRDQRGWPDLVLDQPGRRIAIEIELSPKSRQRLNQVLNGYLNGGRTFGQVHYVVASPALARYITRLYHQLARTRDHDLFQVLPSPVLHVKPLPGLAPKLTEAILDAVHGPDRIRPRPPLPPGAHRR